MSQDINIYFKLFGRAQNQNQMFIKVTLLNFNFVDVFPCGGSEKRLSSF